MNILLTGGAGFIGSHVADALIAGGHAVVVLDNLSTGMAGNLPADALFLRGDIRDAELIERIFRDHRPDIVCHQAAQTSVSASTRDPIADAEVNVLGSLRLLEACRRHGIARFVFASTGGAVYGEVPDEERASEGWPAYPISPYACGKLAFETYLGAYRREHDFPSTILRYGNVYGPRQDAHGEAGVVAIFCRRLIEGAPIRINARQEIGDPGCIRDYIHVADVVRANVLAIEGKLQSSIINVATGRPTTTLEIANTIERALGAASHREFATRRIGDLARSVLEPNPELLAFSEPMSLEAGVADTVRFFTARG